MKKIIISFLTVILLPIPSYSNEVNKTTTTDKVVNTNILTLFQAIDIAIQNSYSLKQSNEKIKTAKYQITETLATIMPQVNINTSYSRQDPIGANKANAVNLFANTQKSNNFNNKISPQYLDQATKKIKKLKIVLKFQHKR